MPLLNLCLLLLKKLWVIKFTIYSTIDPNTGSPPQINVKYSIILSHSKCCFHDGIFRAQNPIIWKIVLILLFQNLTSNFELPNNES